MPETSASLLVRLHDPGDAAAWGRLVELYSPLIRGWLRRYHVPAADADDLAQEVLAILVRELPRFRPHDRPGAFRAWLRTITTNALRRRWRERKVRPEAIGEGAFEKVLDELEDPAGAPSRLWDREHDAFVARRLLAWAEPEFRASTWRAFCRTALDGSPAAEVAAELGLSPNAVLIAKSRVLKRLRELGEDLVGENPDAD